MTLEILRKLGLSEGERRVYLTLLEEGKSPINKLHEKTGIERRNIYDILNKLIEKGIISYTKENKKRFFQSSHPNKILNYLEEQKAKIEETKKELRPLIPELIEKFSEKKQSVDAEIFRGEEGIKAVWEDMLNYPNVYWIGSGRYIPKQQPLFFTHWNNRRIKLKVVWWNLMRIEMKKEVKQMPYEHIKFLPKEFSGSPTVVGIYGNKIVNFLFGENLFAFVIESKELSENYKRYHKYLWEKVAKT